jgi:hypothetical protein
MLEYSLSLFLLRSEDAILAGLAETRYAVLPTRDFIGELKVKFPALHALSTSLAD